MTGPIVACSPTAARAPCSWMRPVVFASPMFVPKQIIGGVDARHSLGQLGCPLGIVRRLVGVQLARQVAPAALDGRVVGARVHVEDAIGIASEGRLWHDTRGYHGRRDRLAYGPPW